MAILCHHLSTVGRCVCTELHHVALTLAQKLTSHSIFLASDTAKNLNQTWGNFNSFLIQPTKLETTLTGNESNKKKGCNSSVSTVFSESFQKIWPQRGFKDLLCCNSSIKYKLTRSLFSTNPIIYTFSSYEEKQLVLLQQQSKSPGLDAAHLKHIKSIAYLTRQ